MHGRTSPRRAPWPEAGTPVVGRAGTTWVFAYDKDDMLWLAPDGESAVEVERGARAVALDCDDDRCALISQRGSETTARVGAIRAPIKSWQRVGLTQFGERGLAARVVGDVTEVAMSGALRVRFVQIDAAGEVTKTGAVRSTPSLVAVSLRARAALTEPPFQLVEGCPSEGGVVLSQQGVADAAAAVQGARVLRRPASDSAWAARALARPRALSLTTARAARIGDRRAWWADRASDHRRPCGRGADRGRRRRRRSVAAPRRGKHDHLGARTLPLSMGRTPDAPDSSGL